MSAADPVLLDIHGLSKRFTGTVALDSVDFDVRAGEVHALLGQNGAGKSTLIKILAGVYPADEGEIRIHGRRVDPASHHVPITFIHQDLGLVDSMTVAENVALLAGYRRRQGLISWRQVRGAAQTALRAMGTDVDPEVKVGTLPAAEKSMVAIARALAVQADLLVLDEPTAALPEADVARLLEALGQLRSRGIGIIYVTHRLDEVFRIADRVTVLRDGKRVATMPVSETSPSDLVHKIVGRALKDVFVKASRPSDKPLLRVDRLMAEHVGPVSFSVAAGEILALVGLRGAGHDIVGRVLFGDCKRTSGEIVLDGRRIEASAPAEAMRQHIGFVSSKRAEESLAGSMLVRENLFLNPVMIGTGVLGIIGRGAESADSAKLLKRFSVRPEDPERVVGTLSGGNQQKVVVARWMRAGSRLLVLEEPTIGVDIGAKAEIYHLLHAALEEGKGILLISSDFEEVARISYRALVFNRGRMIGEVEREHLSIPRLIALASGADGHQPATETAR